MSGKLKPCPFCGKTDYMMRDNENNAVCDYCGARNSDPLEFAHTVNWNSRPVEDALRAEVDDERHGRKLTQEAHIEALTRAEQAEARIAQLEEAVRWVVREYGRYINADELLRRAGLEEGNG